MFSVAALPFLEVIIDSPTLSISILDSGSNSYHPVQLVHHHQYNDQLLLKTYLSAFISCGTTSSSEVDTVHKNLNDDC